MTAPIRIIPLVRESAECWAAMPVVLDRIAMFARKYDADTPGEFLRQVVMNNFVAPPEQQVTRVLVGLKGQEVIAHLLVDLTPWCGIWYATIVQYESDEPLPQQAAKDAHDQMMWWAQGRGAVKMRVLARLDERGVARARAFRQRYGYGAHRVVMDIDIPPREAH